MSRLRIENATLVTAIGTTGNPLGVIRGGTLVAEGGLIVYAGEALGAPPAVPGEVVEDARHRVLLPGFIDAHTHLVFAGNRASEFARRMAGEDYRVIAKEGGGIASTVRHTREASDEELFVLAKARAIKMRSSGTTTIEVKSGYGLTQKDEARCLAIGRRLDSEGIVSTRTTFLGAHTVPVEFRDRRSEYLRLVREEMLPAIAASGLADACDAYIDDGAFSLAEGAAVLEQAKSLGLAIKAHAGQFADLGAAEAVCELGALSVDHLEQVSDEGLDRMAKCSAVAVLLPGAWSTLRQTAPRAERFRARGIRMAVATDFNPGTSPCPDLGLAAALAVRDAGMTVEEAILGITRNAADALGLTCRGRLSPGLRADLCLLSCAEPAAIGYQLGGLGIDAVYLAGEPVGIGSADSSAIW